MQQSFSYNSSYKQIFYLITFVCVALTFVLQKTTTQYGFYLLAVIGLVELVSFVYCSNKVNGGRLSFASLFVFILYLFHFGQVILVGLFENQLTDVRIVITYFSDEESFNGLRIMNLSFALICVGIMLKATALPIQEMVSKDSDSYLLSFRKVGMKIIKVLFPIKLLVDMLFIYKAFAIGFTDAISWLSGFPDIIKSLGELSIIGFALLLVGYKNDKDKQKMLMLGILLYYLLLMSTGRRSENVAYVCSFVFLFIRTYTDKIKLKSFLLCALGGFLLIAVLTTVRNLRQDNRDFSMLVDAFILCLNNPLLLIDVLREYGDTGYTALCVLFLWLPKYAPTYGMSYLLGLSAVFPNIGGIMGELSTESTFAAQMQDKGTLFQEYFNIGGSMMGELYFNFGVTGGIIASLFLGLFIGHFFNIVEKSLYRGDYIKTVTYFLVVCCITYWIRDTFVGGIRLAVWSVLFCNYLFYYKYKLKKA